MMVAMIREMVYVGDKRLRRECKPVLDVFSGETQTHINDMIDTLRDQKGIGLAAPQVGIDQQIFIVAPEQTLAAPNNTLEKGLVVINPSIEFLSEKISLEWEGCLSIPGIRGYVPRICDIKIQYTNRQGEIKEECYDGFTARIFFHEFDHLKGHIFIDHVQRPDYIISDHYYIQKMEEEE